MSRYSQKRSTEQFLKFMGWILFLPARLLIWTIVWALRPMLPREAPSEEAIRLFYQSPRWQALARKVKDKRGRQCECCGAKSTEIKIVTDHVLPLRRYWHLRLSERNLQVLCDVCNRHKGSWSQANFRRLTGPRISLWAR